MIPLAEFTLGAALLTVLEVFLFVAWIWILISVFGDLFSDHTVSGWGKAGWCFLLLFLPFLGVLIYLIARGGSMHERAAARQASAQRDLDAYIRKAAASAPTDELSQLSELRDRGTLTAEEFEAAKRRIVSGTGQAPA